MNNAIEFLINWIKALTYIFLKWDILRNNKTHDGHSDRDMGIISLGEGPKIRMSHMLLNGDIMALHIFIIQIIYY